VAALSVVAFHTTLTGRVGQAGVDVFFVISGFIMFVVSERENKPGLFLVRRLIRIWPLYAIATIAMAIHNSDHLADILRSISFIPYRDAHGHLWPVLVQGWTLDYEFLFYLLITSALFFPRNYLAPSLTLILGGLVAVGLIAHPTIALLTVYTDPLLLEFVFGMWVGWLITAGPTLDPRFGIPLVLISLIAFAISNVMRTPDAMRLLVWGLPALGLVVGALLIEVGGWLPRVAPLTWLGNASYSIYLFHPFLLKTAQRAFGSLPAPIVLVGVLSIVAVAGLALYFGLERWLTELLKRVITGNTKTNTAFVRPAKV
jgi:exopolysaccharide production protein ExoZ